MDEEIAWGVEEVESPFNFARVSVKKVLKKYVYFLPSGRKMTVILDDEPQLKPVAPELKPVAA